MATSQPKTAAELLGVSNVATQGRDRLLDVAIELFYRQGFNAVGLDQVIEKAGVTKTTFYKHFASKEDLMVEAVRRRDAWEVEAWSRAVSKRVGEDPRAKLLAFFDVLHEWFNAPDFGGCLFINAAAEFPNPHDPVHQAAAEYKKRNRDAWCEAARCAGAAEPEAFADFYTMLVEGTLIMRQVHGRNDAAAIASQMAKQLVDQFLPQPPRPAKSKRKSPA